jgi:C-terminal peptidase prc
MKTRKWLIYIILLFFPLNYSPTVGHAEPATKEASPPKAAPKNEQNDPDEEPKPGSDEDTDSWANVEFGPKDMKYVIGLVNQQYYNKNYNRTLSWDDAANYALMFSVKNRVMEIMPESYYKNRKAAIAAKDKKKDPLAEFEDKMEGETFKLEPKDKFLIRVVPEDKDKEKKKKRKLSDDELRALDTRDKERVRHRQKAWTEIGFSEEDFNRVVKYLVTFKGKEDFIKDENGKPGKEKKPVFSEKMMWVYAASGYLLSLDPHSSIISRTAWEKSTKGIEDASFDGIGALLIVQNEWTVIESPLEDQPAARAGLRAGDIIKKVDGVSTFKVPLPQVVKRIKGKSGSSVTLTVERAGQPNELTFTVQRSHIELKNVSSKLVSKESKIGYIKLTGFIEQSYDSIVEHFRALEKEAGDFGALKGLIIDLRGNSGGLLEQAVKIADLFVHKGKIVTVKYGTGKEEVHQARLPDMTKAPLAILVNAMSASASEILASAIQDHHRGLIVGERTFGKASVQQLIPNSAINHTYYTKITIARYYAPSGRTIQVIGVNPDVEVSPEPDGKFPYRFREENYAGHLSEQDTMYEPPNKKLAQSLSACVKEKGQAEKVVKANPNPQIKHDYQLLKAVDYMTCLLKNPAVSAQQESAERTTL